MARLKVPSAYGGGYHDTIGGLGDGLSNFLEYYMRKRLQDRQDSLITNRQSALKKQEYEHADAEKQKLKLEEVPAFIGKVNQDTTDQQIISGLQHAGANLTPQLRQTAQNPGDETTLPSTQYGPAAAKPLQEAFNARTQSGVQEAVAAARKSTEEGQTSYEKAIGTGRAAHEQAPQTSSDAVAAARAMGPVAAENEGLKFDQLNTDARQETGATGAGLKAGAEARARQPYEQGNAKFSSNLRKEEAQALEDWKLNHPQPTASTRTMMEGAQMVLPHVQVLRNQAAELDKAGLFGPVMSRVRQAAAKAGTVDEVLAAIDQAKEAAPQDRNIGKFATELGLMASGAGRVHGGARGGGSPTMVNYMKEIIADSSTLEMFLGRMDSLQGYMEGYAAGPNGTVSSSSGFEPVAENPEPTNQSAVPPSIDALLNRKKQ